MFLVAGYGGGRGRHTLPVLPVQGDRDVDRTVNLGPCTVQDAVGQLHVVDDRHDGVVVVVVLQVARAANVHHQAGARVGHGRGTDRGLVIWKKQKIKILKTHVNTRAETDMDQGRKSWLRKWST